jgi:hypothetical protein
MNILSNKKILRPRLFLRMFTEAGYRYDTMLCTVRPENWLYLREEEQARETREKKQGRSTLFLGGGNKTQKIRFFTLLTCTGYR